MQPWTYTLNFAPVVLRLHERIYVENIDMTVALEKVAFFARRNPRPKRHRPKATRRKRRTRAAHEDMAQQGVKRAVEFGGPGRAIFRRDQCQSVACSSLVSRGICYCLGERFAGLCVPQLSISVFTKPGLTVRTWTPWRVSRLRRASR